MASPISESVLIADQLRRAFEGDAWHGPALFELLEDVDARTACGEASARRPQHLGTCSAHCRMGRCCLSQARRRENPTDRYGEFSCRS